ncbi:ester cyclase [Flavihumibacter rivuli]|uniref:ester cyclase n=1 Tax=Flavihumibacter rivuli TaxID=2838156 RepID=UPI001BDE915B|nr:ester cyclase [Flavihumibacter rivuli]ULQ57108.1 ester cyclase [Flavihumibacter rivuli]
MYTYSIPLFSRFSIIVLLVYFHSTAFGQATKLSNQNKQMINKYFEVVINAHNLDRKGNFFQPDYTWHTMDGKTTQSSQDTSHNATLRWLFSAIPDVHYTIDHILAEEDMVAVNTTATGLAKSELFGLPAGLKKVRYQQMFFYRLKDGKIAEQWEVVDRDGLMEQLGKQ